jgi:hypothetical protein
MNSILPFDELNRFKVDLQEMFPDGKLVAEKKSDIIDELLDLFLLAFAQGAKATNDALSFGWEPSTEEVMKTVDKKIVGKTWRERVEEYFANGGNVADIERIAETEVHRDTNAAAYESAKRAGATTKVWHCMMLPTSRDTHIYLNGVSAPIDGEFYSFKGGSTQFPGEWGIAEEDVNCLCWLMFE